MTLYIYKRTHSSHNPTYTVTREEMSYAKSYELRLEYIDSIDAQDWLERILAEGEDEQLAMLRELQ